MVQDIKALAGEPPDETSLTIVTERAVDAFISRAKQLSGSREHMKAYKMLQKAERKIVSKLGSDSVKLATVRERAQQCLLRAQLAPLVERIGPQPTTLHLRYFDRQTSEERYFSGNFQLARPLTSLRTATHNARHKPISCVQCQQPSTPIDSLRPSSRPKIHTPPHF